jgi:diadenosine tetraphosphate (Ap4A) HIT family hydrolase
MSDGAVIHNQAMIANNLSLLQKEKVMISGALGGKNVCRITFFRYRYKANPTYNSKLDTKSQDKTLMSFKLHPQLEKDCIVLGRFELCQLLLMNDSQFPWFILVPQRADIQEIYQLTPAEQITLIQESSDLAEKLATIFNADKLNIAAIGNIVSQLHVHHVVRYRSDKAWAAPIWGKFAAVPYTAQQLCELKAKLTPLELLH